MIKQVPAKVDFIQLEHEILDMWKKEDIFNKLRAKNATGPKWRFIDGPITANNPMGVHHAWGRSLKDIFHRYKAMQGYQTRYQNGFDCQGLWVEVEVEKELGFKSKTDIEEYGVENFVQRCKERVEKYAKVQTEQSIRLGYWMDWDNSYFTMSEENNYTIWQFLKKCHERGWIFKGHDVMPWCPKCGAALSEHEIATEGYKEMTHTSITAKFPLKDKKNEYLLVWTTTPWTLSSNTAAAVHPDKDYIKVRQNDNIYYLIEGRKEILKGKGPYEVLESLKGKDMLGWEFNGPFDELPVQKGVVHKIIPWEEVTDSEGTGIVHIAPGCGKEDHQLGKEHNLAIIAPIDQFGTYLDGFDWLSGRNVDDVLDDILQNLREKGYNYSYDPYTHRYPVCWRHGTPLVFRLVDEWFIAMDEVRHDIMEVTKQITWMPSYGLDRELDWLRNMHDWMISKKRFWGLALPIYECECGNIEVIGSREELQARAVEGWEEFDGHTPHKPYIDKVKIACSKCGKKVSRIEDVGNPWLDAGIVPYSTIKYRSDKEYWNEWFPAEFITESLPGQFRNWFYVLLAMSTVLENRPPFEKILGYALVKDEHGDDMHKSAGNAIWFDDAAEKMGVDVMRWMYSNHNPFTNLNFGYSIATDTRKKLITLWNSYSFFATYAELDGFDPQKHVVENKDLAELDLWLKARLNQLIREVTEDYDEYRVDKAMKEIDIFIEDLSNWYIRRSRRRFWKSDDDKNKWAAYQTLYNALTVLVQLLAPVIPFITDYIYQNLVRNVDKNAPQSIHLTEFPKADETSIDENLINKINMVIKLTGMGRAARNLANLKVRQPLAELLIKAPGDATVLKTMETQFKEELNVKSVRILESEGEIVEFSVKPNFVSLKEKYPKEMGQIIAGLKKAEAADIVAQLNDKGLFQINLPAGNIILEKTDLIVEKTGKEGYSVITEYDFMAAVTTALTPELIKEGLVRDFIRQIQTLRKEADYKVEDRISVAVEAYEELREAIEAFKGYFTSETLTNELVFEYAEGETNSEIEIDGNPVKVAITKIQ
ncbi:MAG: isoleucine--tRNA ligase [Candidatus Marinimicrobia bacterium]|nr:isoleucine--tRNA ligase [Candidatus Neomarinimicrobiota bacterium]